MKKFTWSLALGGLCLNFVAAGCSSNPGEVDKKGAVTPAQQAEMDEVAKTPK